MVGWGPWFEVSGWGRHGRDRSAMQRPGHRLPVRREPSSRRRSFSRACLCSCEMRPLVTSKMHRDRIEVIAIADSAGRHGSPAARIRSMASAHRSASHLRRLRLPRWERERVSVAFHRIQAAASSVKPMAMPTRCHGSSRRIHGVPASSAMERLHAITQAHAAGAYPCAASTDSQMAQSVEHRAARPMPSGRRFERGAPRADRSDRSASI